VSGARPTVFWDIVEESLDEAEFLWGRWESALVAADQRLADVSTWTEERLLGSIEGLVVAGEAGIARVLAPALASDEIHRVTAAAHALIAGSFPASVEVFASAFRAASPETRTAMRRGLELAAADRGTDTILAHLFTGASDELKVAVLDAASFADQFWPRDLEACLRSELAGLQRAAARQLACAPSTVQARWIDHALTRLGPSGRAAAVETAMRVGHPAALDACRELAAEPTAPGDPTSPTAPTAPTAPTSFGGDMLMLLATMGTAADHQLVIEALGQADRRRAALWSLGFAGRRAGAAACIDLLAQGVEPRLGAETFAAITGVDLAAEGLVVPAAPASDGPAEPDDDDGDVPREEAEDAPPEPHIPGLISWWARHQTRFDDRSRYVAGQPMTFGLLQERLEQGPMRRRGPIAMELSIRTGGRYRVRTSDFTRRQRRQMAGFRTLPREAFAGEMARELMHPGRGNQ
jgi:uncharacterized protein (TIGR02270 family)